MQQFILLALGGRRSLQRVKDGPEILNNLQEIKTKREQNRKKIFFGGGGGSEILKAGHAVENAEML